MVGRGSMGRSTRTSATSLTSTSSICACGNPLKSANKQKIKKISHEFIGRVPLKSFVDDDLGHPELDRDVDGLGVAPVHGVQGD